jgi:trehalose-phosphatase
LDFDGTLAPIVPRPEMAEMPVGARRTLKLLAQTYPVCVVSGRPLDFLRYEVGLDDIYYAADHGHHVVGPPGSHVDFQIAPDDSAELDAATHILRDALRDVRDVSLEAKEVSMAVHYRQVAEDDRAVVREAVDEALRASPGLRMMEGKMVYELLPDIAWGKGQAVRWLMDRLQPTMTGLFAVCVGDDLTDEEMFAAVRGRGISVLVGDPERPTQADYYLSDPSQVGGFLLAITARSGGPQEDVV